MRVGPTEQYHEIEEGTVVDVARITREHREYQEDHARRMEVEVARRKEVKFCFALSCDKSEWYDMEERGWGVDEGEV